MRNLSPAFSFYPKDFLSSPKVQAMTVEEVGAYCLLLSAAWIGDPQGTLPNDPELLRRICRMTPEQWTRSSKLVLSCFEENNGVLFNPRLLHELARQQAHSAAQRANVMHRYHGNTTVVPSAYQGSTKTYLPSPSPSPSPSPDVVSETTSPQASDDAAGEAEPSASPAKGETLTAIEAAVVAAWNGLGAPFAAVRRVGNRRRHLKARLADGWWRENWQAAIARVCSSAGLSGKNDRGWIADFDWFLRPGTAEKLLEGKYDSWGKAGLGTAGDDSWMYVGLEKK